MIKTYLFCKDDVREDVPLADWRKLTEDEHALIWVDVHSYDEAELNDLAGIFGLHAISIESCLDPYRRPHLYEFEDHFYVNLTLLEKSRIEPSELHLFASEKWVLTLSPGPGQAAEEALKEYRDAPRLSEKGAMYAAYLLIENLVESYYPVVEGLDDEADRLETDMLGRPDKDSLARLFDIKRRAFDLRRLLGPQRDVLTELSKRDFTFISGEHQVYFQDLYNRMVRLFDMIDTIREILSGSLDIYLSMASNRLNEIMKVLTVAATILMMLSFIAGFFGMNFKTLPWIRSPHGFRNIIVTMVISTLAMAWWFRRKGWM